MRDLRFTFLCTQEERTSLERLAAHYQRSKGDTIRLLIQERIMELSKYPKQSDHEVNLVVPSK